MEGLSKVLVELPGAPIENESLWARPLGDDLYELRNTPWLASDLNFLDVVRAIPDAPGEMPRVVEVVRRGGHRTLRVVFAPGVPEPERSEMLGSLNRWRAFYENGDGTLYSLNVEPGGDYEATCDQLSAWERAGRLHYEPGTSGDGRPHARAPRRPEGVGVLLDILRRFLGRPAR